MGGLRHALERARSLLRGFVQVLEVDIDALGSRSLQARFLCGGWCDVATTVVFYSGHRRHRPFPYDGGLRADSMASFAILQLHVGMLELPPDAAHALQRQRVPTAVLRISTGLPDGQDLSATAIVEEFEAASSYAQQQEQIHEGKRRFETPRRMAFAVVDERRGRGGKPSFSLTVSSPTGVQRVFLGKDLAREYSRADWIRNAEGAVVLPELTALSAARLLSFPGVVVAFSFDHRSEAVHRQVAAMGAALSSEFAAGGRVSLVTYDSGSPNRGSLHFDQEAMVIFDTSWRRGRGDVPPEVFLGVVSNRSALEGAAAHLRRVVQEQAALDSEMVWVLPDAATRSEAAVLMSVFREGASSGEIDNVDGRLTYDFQMPTLIENCTGYARRMGVAEDICEVEEALVERLQPFVREALRSWNLGGPIDDIQLCASFVRSYLAGERRRLGAHYDEALISINLLLNDPADFDGGLVLTPPDLQGAGVYPEREARGAAMYPGSIFHEVLVRRGRRFTWIAFWDYQCRLLPPTQT